MKTLFLIALSILILSCQSVKKPIKSENFIVNDSINLYAFVGKKIYIKKSTPKPEPKEFFEIDGEMVEQLQMNFNLRFKAKYKIEEIIYNDLNKNSITFFVYDHNGKPKFKKYNHVILYLSKEEDSSGYYLQKYLYDPVHKNRDGNWVGPNNESLKDLFNVKKKGVLKARGIIN